ncbi:MAG: uracil-DNA glycosylase, partial [Gemmatimonadota bacterium]
MSDTIRRYLEQQLELGGSEVVVSRTPLPASEAAPAPETPEAGRWRKDAPPIPGPGLVIQPLLAEDDPRAGIHSLAALAQAIDECTRCPLHLTRTKSVPGEGDPKAGLFLVGEGPGETEDRLGRPFVGRAGDLLDKLLAALDLPRSAVYIANIVKNRPPQNRKPLPDEVAACIPFLYRQIAIVQPKVILAMGGTAGESLLGVKKSLGEIRGKVHRFAGIPLIVTYHPAALLRNPNWKKPTWDDVRIARQLLDL